MTLPTFTPPIAPSPGTTNKPEFKILSAEFGDGLTQEAPDGLNNVRDVLTLSWQFLHPAHARTITDFLRARKGVEPFLYQPSGEAAPRKWTCKDYSDRMGEGGFRTVEATFRQSFTLGS